MQILTYNFKTILSPLCTTADIEQCNTVGWTALHHACFHGHNDVIQGNLLWGIDKKTVKAVTYKERPKRREMPDKKAVLF